MTQIVTVAIIASIPPTIAALAALIVSNKNHQAVREVHLSLNSRLDQLLGMARAAGVIEGRKVEGDERDSKSLP